MTNLTSRSLRAFIWSFGLFFGCIPLVAIAASIHWITGFITVPLIFIYSAKVGKWADNGQ